MAQEQKPGDRTSLATERPQGLRFGPIAASAVHICVDMQRLFALPPWRTPWMDRILPDVVSLVSAKPERTLFTRFIPVRRAADGVGTWRRYWEQWEELTLERIEQSKVRLFPELEAFTPPALVIDKKTYSPWANAEMSQALSGWRTDTLLITGGETDVCVLATMLGAVDRGFRVIVVADALCSSSDESHDALLSLYAHRYSQQVETASVAEVLFAWARV